MKKYLFLIFSLLLLALPLPVLANNKLDESKIVTLKADEVVDGNYYAAGEIVEIFGTVHGDVYAAGGQVFVNGKIDGDLLVAGGTVTISGTVGEDVRAAGGQVTISAEVGKNLSVAGGNVELTNSASVGDGLQILGGDLTVSAPVGQELYAAGGNLTLTNTLGKGMHAAIGTLRITSTAAIGGDLDYWSQEQASIDNSASISGTLTRHDTSSEHVSQNLPNKQTLSKLGRSISWGIKTASLVMTLIIGLLLLRLFPSYANRAAATLKQRLASSLGLGFAGLMAFVLVFIVLLISLIGIPFAILLLIWLLLYTYVARIYALLAMGRYVLGKIERDKIRSGWAFVTGVVIYYFVTMIPILGGLFKLVFVLAAFGALLLNDKATYKLARKHKII
jgi:cytoskeletal protein CcmA (bactofilin family)